ncbi:EF-hand domain-containing protein [Thermodesulfobacteriota bacterium]
MKNCVLTYLVVITLFISNALCFGNEGKSHICFRVVDADKDGKVTFQEFKKIYGDDKVKFEAIDLNDDGKLSHDEYHQFLGHGSL